METIQITQTNILKVYDVDLKIGILTIYTYIENMSEIKNVLYAMLCFQILEYKTFVCDHYIRTMN